MLHFGISINHIAFCTVYVVAQLGDSGILTRDLFTKVLRLILSRLDNSNHFVKLVVRIGDLFLLELEDLAVVKFSCLLKLTIFSATEIFLILCSQRSLCVVQGPIFLGQLSADEFLNIVDKIDTAADLFFAYSLVLMRLILIIVHQLVKVTEICL